MDFFEEKQFTMQNENSESQNEELKNEKSQNEELLSAVIDNTKNPIQISDVVIGIISDIDESGRVIVDFHENFLTKPLFAKSMVKIDESHKNQQVALLFDNNESDKPIIMGLMHTPDNRIIAAKKNLTIKCGKSSIELRANGEIIIEGNIITSRAKKNYIIKGGTIHLN